MTWHPQLSKHEPHAFAEYASHAAGTAERPSLTGNTMEQGALNASLSALGQLMGLPTLCFDDQGCCQLVFDERWLVTLVREDARARLYLHCPISPPGAAERLDASVLQVMLQANFMGRGARGGTLAIGQDQRACVQCEFPYAEAADERMLMSAIEQLLVSAENWAARLESSPAESARRPKRAPPFTRSLA